MRLTDKNHFEMAKVEILVQKNKQDLLNIYESKNDQK